LVYNGVSYGLLAVYHDQPNRFDETERRLLYELADTVAFAIHSLETESALAANQTVDVTVELAADAYYLVDLARDGAFDDCDGVHVRGTVPHDEGATIQYVAIEDGPLAAVSDRLDAHPAVSDAFVITEQEPARLQLTVTEPVPERVLATRGVVVRSTTVNQNGATIEIELQTKTAVRPTVETLEDAFGPASVRSVSEHETEERSNGRPTPRPSTLTEKQATALEAAYHHGYFEQPRESSASEVAESLGVTHSTFLQHLRTAQQKTFEAQFE
jgi:predicted DNA binding protein